ncbi:MAG: ATP-binding protein [Gammaproteobacteria bacterium]|nr:ATP-binding protein [Gammaproteobacteria bacterium]
MEDFEKLGAFYLGRTVDDHSGKTSEDLLLYDSKDLTTHAVIIGMTGSGKTGLGIGLIEEAAIDSIPVIAIDPKGDLGNLLLTFPDFSADDFEPWVDAREAAEHGHSPREHARDRAAAWQKGLAEWGQSGARIRKLRDTAELAIYTPGSSAGLPISVLRRFDAPSAASLEDADLYHERLQATASGLLALLGMDADPLTSREHILLANLFDNAWREGRGLDLATLIGAIQQPPIDRIGVMDLEAFYPARERFGLAMKLNSLLAAPGFAAWMEGEPLDAARLLYTPQGKPRVSVLSIAHLDDNERMFFVCMLLNALIGWMRTQPGTGSLRALLYMDEILGYMPPVANPPSKPLLLSLLKQARAYGLGLALSTQNPVDLDYKGLSNTGTWFIGRLQTERDMARVMEGLEGAAGDGFDRERIRRTIAGLGKRRFLLHNVHEDAPVVFDTRWVMSYLAGPMTREQIRGLMAGRREQPGNADQLDEARSVELRGDQSTGPPALAADIEQFFLPITAAASTPVHYRPTLMAAADLFYTSSRYGIESERRWVLLAEPGDGVVSIDWDQAEQIDLDIESLQTSPEPDCLYADCPAVLTRSSNYRKWQSALKRWLRQSCPLTLHQSTTFKLHSVLGESEGEFRVRLQQHASEQRDQVVARLRQRYAQKTNTLEERLRRAEQTLEREREQSRARQIDVAISFGGAILGAVLGRKRRSAFGSALRGVGRAGKEVGDVGRAKETVEAVRQDLHALQRAFEAEVDAIEPFDAQAEVLNPLNVRARASDIHLIKLALLWQPFVADERGRLQPAWED